MNGIEYTVSVLLSGTAIADIGASNLYYGVFEGKIPPEEYIILKQTSAPPFSILEGGNAGRNWSLTISCYSSLPGRSNALALKVATDLQSDVVEINQHTMFEDVVKRHRTDYICHLIYEDT